MDTSSPPFFTNEACSELLSNLDKPAFTEEQLASFSEGALAVVQQRQAYVAAHPPVGVYRIATEGSQTRNGGVIQKTLSPWLFRLDNGQEVRGAHKGDHVIYPDGSTARIVNGAGHEYGHLALVGSRLSNGDEVINTLQSSGLLVLREGVPMAKDFLPPLDA